MGAIYPWSANWCLEPLWSRTWGEPTASDMAEERTSDRTLVPVWDGRHESWHHFLVEVKWTLSSMKPSERPLLAARLIRKNLQNGPAPLVQLLYKLDPEDFKGEEDVTRLIRFLETSPLNKQPLPEAGNRIGAYYRRLHRKPHESVRQYIVREEKVHDDMLKALQRLLRERELDFDQYDCTLEELKEFVGMKDGASVFFDDAASAAPSVAESGSGRNPFSEDAAGTTRDRGRGLHGEADSNSSVPRAGEEQKTSRTPSKGKDLLQRLMEKGLMPLSALDVIRGWLLLETCIPGDENGKRMVKAATRNKLTYAEIRSALTNMYEDSSGGARSGKGYNYFTDGHYAGDEWYETDETYEDDGVYYQAGWEEDQWTDHWSQPDWDQTAWAQTDWSDPSEWHEEEVDQEQEVNTEELKSLLQAQEEAEKHQRDLTMMMAENDRNLTEARKAVAAAAKDRGWGGSPQQGKGRPTTTYPGKNGKGKTKGKSKHEAHWFKGKGNYKGNNFKGFKGNSFGKKGFSQFSKGNKGGGQFVLDADYELMTVVENGDELPESLHSQTKASKEPIFPSEAIIDTGATASAGGQEAVTQLCAAISRARPNTRISVFQGDRPWFRYGSGEWGQALFRVQIQVPPKEISIFALPSPGVPVLIGMRELSKLDAILSCHNSKGLILGECVHFRRTKKLHLVMDFLKHVFLEPCPSSPTTSMTTTNKATRHVSFTETTTSDSTHNPSLHVLELSYDANDFDDCEMIAWDDLLLHESVDKYSVADERNKHLGITAEQWMHLASQTSSNVNSASSSDRQPDLHHVEQHIGRGCIGRTQEHDQVSSERGHGTGEGQGNPFQKEEPEDTSGVRLNQASGSGCPGSPSTDHSMAMLRQASGERLRQQIRPLEGMSEMCTEDSLRTRDQLTGRIHQVPPSHERDRGIDTPTFSRMDQRERGVSSSEVNDRHSGQGESRAQPEEQSSSKESSCRVQEGGGSTSARDNACRGQEGQIRREGSPHSGKWQQPGQQPRSQQRQWQPVLRESGLTRKEGQEAEEPQQRPEGGVYEVTASQGGDDDTADGMDTAETLLTTEQQRALRKQLESAADNFAIESLMEMMADAVEEFHAWELCCSKNSALTSACLRLKLRAVRKTLETGYDFEKESTADKLNREFDTEKPKKSWFSLRCTEWSSIQNINQRNPVQIEQLRKKRQRGKRQIRTAIKVILHMLDENPLMHIYWEWPKWAAQGWNLPEMKHLYKEMQKRSTHGIFWTQIDGCTFGMKSPDDEHIQKSWYILHTDPEFHQSCQRLCPGDHKHRPGGMIGMGSQAVANTAYYPEEMADMIARHWKKQWATFAKQFEEKNLIEHLHQLEQHFAVEEATDGADITHIKKETIEMAKKLLTKVHRASGHPSNTALARLCKDKKFPEWVVQLAKELHCDACNAVQRGEQKIPNVSLGTKPQPWQLVGLDVFELAFPQQQCKGRYLLCVCLAMRLMSVVLLQQTSLSQTGTDSGKSLIEGFTQAWLMHRPRPLWVVVDAQTSLAKGEFVQFAQLAGFGITAVPGEAHYMHGGTESAVKTVKNLMKRFRFEFPHVPPKLLGMIAATAHNNNYMLHGFSPVQWAYGFAPDSDHNTLDPLEVNVNLGTQPNEFWELQQNRHRAAELWRQEHAKTTWTKVTNTIPRPVRDYQPGDWVCVWRHTTWKMRKKGSQKGTTASSFNPEARFVGPGRVLFTEPAVLPGGRGSVVWVLMSTQVWRCSPDQLRMASETEVNMELLEKGSKITRPVMDTLKQLTKVTDITQESVFDWDEPALPDEPHPEGAPLPEEDMARAQPSQQWFRGVQEMSDEWTRRVVERHARDRSRSRERKQEENKQQDLVKQVRRWQQLISVNENRRREGLPPIMKLPEHVPEFDDDMENTAHEDKKAKVEHFSLEENDVPVCEESYEEIMMKIEQLEETAKQISELEQLREQLHHERREEQKLLQLFSAACDTEEEICEISFDLDNPMMLIQQGFVYTKAMLQGPSKEVVFRQLTPQHKELFQEAMAREISEVLRSQAVRATKEKLTEEEVKERIIPMRWVLTWKFIPGTTVPKTDKAADTTAASSTETANSKTMKKKTKHEVTDETGQYKAKARLVLLGFKHPDLAARDPRTGQRKLATAAPTLTRTSRNLLLQASAMDEHTVESADAKSAFLQSQRKLEGEPLYTRGVDELAHALHVTPGVAIQIIGAFYGLTISPRMFWLDADEHMRKRGGITHPCEKCLWIFLSEDRKRVIGRVGAHVDDFLICGSEKDVEWQKVRNSISTMYSWSPWQKGTFTFAGCEVKQMKDFSIHLTQTEFSIALRTIDIESDKSRSDNDALTPAEISQFRGGIMKASWRAVQTSPQYAARVNITASKANTATVGDLRETNRILKDMKKTSTVGLTFPAFNSGRSQPFSWKDMVMLHFGDASQHNRPDGSATGGYITGFSNSDILSGNECPMSVIDWRSWRLERPTKGSNGCESQAVYETEDRGWKCRIIWKLLYEPFLIRGDQDSAAASIESLLIMDSRGLYDAITLSETAFCGMSSARTGTEAMAIQRGTRPNTRCYATWVPSDMNLADALTKISPDAFKVIQLYLDKRTWCVRFQAEFVSARKAQKLRRQKQLEDAKINTLLGPLLEEDPFDLAEELPDFKRPLQWNSQQVQLRRKVSCSESLFSTSSDFFSPFDCQSEHADMSLETSPWARARVVPKEAGLHLIQIFMRHGCNLSVIS